MKLSRSIAIALAALLLSTGSALAAYRSDKDITLNLILAPSLIKPSGALAQPAFAVQEGAHEAISGTLAATSLERYYFDHSYVWLEVNDVPIVPIDPFWASGRNPVVD